MNPKKKVETITVSTTLDKEIYDWIREQMPLNRFIELMAKDFASTGIKGDELYDITRRLKFFASKTIELQGEVKVLKQENRMLQAKMEVHNSKIKKINKEIEDAKT